MSTYNAASAGISISPNLRGFGKELRKQLRTVNVEHEVNVLPDMAGFRQRLQTQLDAIHANLHVGLDVDTAGLRTQLEAVRVTIPVGLDVDTAAARAQLDSLGSVAVQVQATGDMSSLQVVHAQMQAWLVAHPLTVQIKADRSALAGLSGQLGQMATNANRASSSTSRAGGALRSLAGSGARVGLISVAVAGIGGAAGAAAGAVGGLAVGLAGLGAAGLPAIGAITVGLSGIADAFKAFGQSASGGGGAAVDTSSQIASAEHGVQMALRSSKDAQEDLTRARKDARREIDDLNMSLKASALDEREAAIAVADARDELARTNADPKASARDRQKAQLALEQAQLRQEEAAKRGKRLATDTAEANRKGVEGSDQVVAAKRSIADADYQVAEARRALADAQKQAATGGGADPVADALAKLAPNAREFVLAVRSMGDAWNEVKMSTQDALFKGAAAEFQSLASTYLPVLKEGLTTVATSLNGAAHGMSSLLQQEGNVGKIGTAFAGSAVFIDQAKQGLFDMTQGLIDVGAAAAPAAAQLGAGFGAIPGEIGKAFTDLANSGALTQLFQSFGEFMQNGLGPALGDLIRALTTVGNEVLPALTPAFAALGDALVTIGPSLGQLGAAFASALVPLLPIVAQFVSVLAQGLTPIMPILGQIIGALGQALMPLIPPLSQALQTVGQVIAQLLPIAGPVFTQLAQLLAQVFEAVAPLLPPLFELAAAILTPLIGVFQKLVAALAPFIEQLVGMLAPVIEKMTPIFEQYYQILGDALVQGIQALIPVMGPLIDAFLQLVMAVLPILPPIADLAAQLLPLMLTQFTILAPVLTELIKVFTWLVTNVLVPLVIPILEKLTEWVGKVADNFGYMSGKVGDAIQFVKDKVGEAKDWVVEKFTAVVDFVKTLPQKISDGTRGMWDGIKDAFRDALNWLIQKWNDFSLGFDFTIPVINKHISFSIDTPNMPLFADGGPVTGGQRGKDSVPAMLMPGEHVLTTSDVSAMGGQQGVYDFRRALHFADGGAVPGTYKTPDGLTGGTVQLGDISGPGITTDIQQSMWDAARKEFPDAVLASATRTVQTEGHADYHNAGKAIDFGGPASSFQRIAAWIAKTFPNSLELINSPFDHNIKDGKDVGDGFAFYGADTMAGHTDHTHWAMGEVIQPASAQPAEPAAPPSPTVVAPDNPTTVAPDTKTTPSATESGPVAPSQILHKFGETTGGIIADSLLKIFDPGGDLGPQTYLSAADRYAGLAQAIAGGRPKTESPAAPSTTTPTAPVPEAAAPGGDAPKTAQGGQPVITYDPAGGAEQWRPLADWAIEHVNQSMKGITQTTAMVEQIHDESGGDPRAVNNGDSNAAAGTRSGGLLQVIGPTFAANRDPSLPDDVFDPAANLVAALRYYVPKYGKDLTVRWGAGKGGYKSGGYTGNGPRDQFAGFVHGQEFVVNAAATRRNLPTLQAMNAGASVGGMTSQSWRPGVQINNHLTVSNERSQMRELRRQDERVLMQYGGAHV